ncbi:MAG TPA: tetraacyldisaccharide 4'-kinase [Bacteroidales bacterium]|nr:tetraacyldisaccharide 4'-kinase [Bacteroidales bacterium]
MNVRLFLVPFSWIFGLIVACRRRLYKYQLIKSVRFPIPTICIGNLKVGGTGKTPHIEYLITQLKDHYQIAVLSRGYGRKTKGFILANHLTTSKKNAIFIGDEPLQFHSKFPDIPVAVCEKRSLGIQQLMMLFPKLDLILLDDAFQHLAVNYSLKILLTEFQNPYTKDFPFPAGNLREHKNAAHHADIVIVTKSPVDCDPLLIEVKKKQLKIKKDQELFFTSIVYKPLQPLTPSASIYPMDSIDEIIVFTGIANGSPLLQYLEKQFSKISYFSFPDHHCFSHSELENIKNRFEQDPHKKKIILTTEKDWMRLSGIQENCLLLLPVFSIPIEIRFHEKEDIFLNIIKDHVRKD